MADPAAVPVAWIHHEALKRLLANPDGSEKVMANRDHVSPILGQERPLYAIAPAIPREPTERMIEAGLGKWPVGVMFDPAEQLHEIYVAMYDAAPTGEEPTGK